MIEVDGVVDAASSPRFAELIRKRLDSTVRTLVLDLSRVSFFDTAGVVALTEAAYRTQICDAALVLVTANRAVDAPLRLLDLGGMFAYADTIAAGLKR